MTSFDIKAPDPAMPEQLFSTKKTWQSQKKKQISLALTFPKTAE
jgi:hypothetical protein